MPIIKSAIKRVRQQKRRRARNLIVIRSYKAVMKEFEELVEAGKIAEATKAFPGVQKAIDLATKKNLLHKNTAGRKKSRLVKLLSQDKKKAAPASAKKEASASEKKEEMKK